MYKDARKRAGLSIEEAAFRMHIAPRSLVNYENGNTMLPPDVALNMAEVYEEPEIVANYCTECCPIGQKYAENIDIKDLASAVLGLLKEHNDVTKIRDRLIEISSDGVISDEEKIEFEGILAELLDLEQKIETIKFLAARFLPVDDIIQRRKEKALARAI